MQSVTVSSFCFLSVIHYVCWGIHINNILNEWVIDLSTQHCCDNKNWRCRVLTLYSKNLLMLRLRAVSVVEWASQLLSEMSADKLTAYIADAADSEIRDETLLSTVKICSVYTDSFLHQLICHTDQQLHRMSESSDLILQIWAVAVCTQNNQLCEKQRLLQL